MVEPLPSMGEGLGSTPAQAGNLLQRPLAVVLMIAHLSRQQEPPAWDEGSAGGTQRGLLGFRSARKVPPGLRGGAPNSLLHGISVLSGAAWTSGCKSVSWEYSSVAYRCRG